MMTPQDLADEFTIVKLFAFIKLSLPISIAPPFTE